MATVRKTVPTAMISTTEASRGAPDDPRGALSRLGSDGDDLRSLCGVMPKPGTGGGGGGLRGPRGGSGTGVQQLVDAEHEGLTGQRRDAHQQRDAGEARVAGPRVVVLPVA